MTGIRGAAAALAEGRPVLLAEGWVVLAAALADPAAVAWTVRYSSGFLTVPLETARADELDLPHLPRSSGDRPRQTVAVDAADGISTGISATDRARTARLLADPLTRADDLRRPGHLVPMTVAAGGVLEQVAAPEAAVDLCRHAGLAPVGVLAALEPTVGAGTITGSEVRRLADEHRLAVIEIAELVEHRRARLHEAHAARDADDMPILNSRIAG